MSRLVFPVIMFMQIVNLCVAVMAGRNTVIRSCCHYLLKFPFAVFASGFGKSGLKEPSSAATAVVVRLVGSHFYKIFLAHNCFNNIPQVFCHRVAQTLANQLAWVLYSKFYFQVFVPVGINFQFSFPDPLGIILNNALDLKIVIDVEFFQPDPDCKKFVPSFRVEPNFVLKIIYSFGLDPNNMLPTLVIRQKHAVVFRCPSLGAVSPVGSYQV
ncbi:MAG: hypothetical protein SRB2_04754 [Desulfobacteraceae bacterium Eth-SRB2]|nr:MAG: hypothetical protein SRB2_04754 [Desulfobacteraceae bacterium Eth-SRB2]